MIQPLPKNEWWGYLHTNGTVQVKRAFSDLAADMADAQSSPFVRRVYGPVLARRRERETRQAAEARPPVTAGSSESNI